MPLVKTPITKFVISYNSPWVVTVKQPSTKNKFKFYLKETTNHDPNGIYANTTKLPFKIGKSTVLDAERLYQGLKGLLRPIGIDDPSDQDQKKITSHFETVANDRESRNIQKDFGKKITNQYINSKSPQYKEELALEFMTQIKYIQFSQQHWHTKALVAFLNTCKRDKQSLSDALVEQLTFIEDCPSGSEPSKCRDPRWGAIFDPFSKKIAGQNLQGKAVKEALLRVIRNYEGNNQTPVNKTEFYANGSISPTIAQILNNVANKAQIKLKDDEKMLKEDHEFKIIPTYTYNDKTITGYNPINPNPQNNTELAKLISILKPTPEKIKATTENAPAKSSISLESTAEELAQHLISKQEEIYNALFKTTDEASLTDEKKEDIRNHVLIGHDWYAYASSSLQNPELSVLAADDISWVPREHLSKSPYDDAAKRMVIEKGKKVYEILANNKEYCTRYVDCVKKYIASHSENDSIYDIRLSKVVESLIGLTQKNTRILANFGDRKKDQDDFIKELCAFIKKHEPTLYDSSDNKVYSQQFFHALKIAEQAINIQTLGTTTPPERFDVTGTTLTRASKKTEEVAGDDREEENLKKKKAEDLEKKKAEDLKKKKAEEDEIKEILSEKGEEQLRKKTIAGALISISNDQLAPENQLLSERLSISKGNIFANAVKLVADQLDKEIEGGGDFLRKQAPQPAGEGEKSAKTKEDLASERILITSDIMRFSTKESTKKVTILSKKDGRSLLEEDRRIKETTMIVDGKYQPLLPSTGLQFATLAGLKLVDLDKDNPIFPKGVDITGMNFNGCDVTHLNLSNITPEAFASLRFVRCVGLDKMFENGVPTDPETGEKVKLKTSAVTVKKHDGSFDISSIGSQAIADKIMEHPEHFSNPKGNLSKPLDLSAKNLGVERSIEQLRIPRSNPSSPSAAPLFTHAASKDI